MKTLLIIILAAAYFIGLPELLFREVQMKKVIILAMLLMTPMTAQAKTIVDMGEFKITYFCPCLLCSEGYGRETATPGVYARSSHTIAVDKNVIGLGSKVEIDGQTYIAEDVGGGVKGDHIDIFVDTHEETISLGVKHKNVKIIRED